MTREETKKIVCIMMITWPHYKPELSNDTISIMHEMIGDLDYIQTCAALKAYAQTDTSGFAPSIGQIRAKQVEMTTAEEMGDGEAWALVRRAISNSAYFAQAEFDKLPEIVRQAVGSPRVLKGWAVSEEDHLDYARGEFIKMFRAAKARHKERLQLSNDMRAIMDSRPKIGETQQAKISEAST